jgi:hypothetical protein
MAIDLEKRRPQMACELNGVKIESRHNDPQEIDVMMRALMVLPAKVQDVIKSIWCDSNACCDYSVEVKEPVRETSALAARIKAAFVAANGGFNGLTISHEAGFSESAVEFDPEWEEEVKAFFHPKSRS